MRMYIFFKLCVMALPLIFLSVNEYAQGLSVVLQNTNITKLSARTLHSMGYRLHLIEHLSIMGAPDLESVVVEDLSKMTNLKSFFITQAPMLSKIDQVPPMPELRTFIITTSGLQEVPNLSKVHDNNKTHLSVPAYLQAVDLEGNHIRSLNAHALRVRADQVPDIMRNLAKEVRKQNKYSRSEIIEKSLNYNLLEEVPALAFKNAQISRLSFRGNYKLKRLDDQAFAGNLLLRQLDLSSTAITTVPTKGLENLQVLRIEKTPTLKYIPSIYEFRHLEKAYLTHHFHCCAFAFPERHDPVRHALYQTNLKMMQEKCGHTERPESMTPVNRRRRHRQRRSLEPILVRTQQSLGEDDENTAVTSEEYDPYASQDYGLEPGSFEEEDLDYFHDPINNTLGAAVVHADCGNFSSQRDVECTPLPNALNPCEDVMGWTWLRACVWFVITAAMIGNLAVLTVLLTNRSELTVSRFLMCHLAFSDMCTGVYLFMIAVVDLKSYSEYFNYAFDWQYGTGCKITGFLSVFSGQLSVITLTIVTLERWFAITYAIYLERRISLSAAAKIMIGGWLFSIFMAALPLAGVSDYSSTSICLPVESTGIGDAVYQASILMTSALAWVTIVVCYVQIYRSLGGGSDKYGGRGAAAAAERRIANKMALLIGTNLLCWSPVAFFGITALAGVPLVDVSHGKVLLVFFYPLNACANPFLYAILTKQYRRDFIMMLGRTGKCHWLIEKYKLQTTPPATAHTHPSNPPLIPLADGQRRHSHCKENGETLM